MQFKVTVTCCFEAESADEALEVRRDAHYALEDALVDHTTVEDPNPDPQAEEFNLSRGKLEGLDQESRSALESLGSG